MYAYVTRYIYACRHALPTRQQSRTCVQALQLDKLKMMTAASKERDVRSCWAISRARSRGHLCFPIGCAAALALWGVLDPEQQDQNSPHVFRQAA